MVLLVLAIVWGVLLVSWLRSRTEGTLSDSVGTFRRHLTVLERAAPTTVAPANRLYGTSGLQRRPIPAFRSVTPIPGSRIAVPSRPVPVGYGGGGGALPAAGRRVASQVALRRRQAQKRRRDVFVALLAGVVGSFLLAVIPGLSVMWSVQILFDVLMAGYVALLVRIRNAAAERDLKMTRIPRQRALSANRPANRPGYDFGAPGYGELDLRRAN